MRKIVSTLGLTILTGTIALAGGALDLERPEQNDAQNLAWVGHLSPDTDTVVSGILAASLYGGKPTSPAPLSPETRFVLDYCEITPPEVVSDYSTYDVGLVDFNQMTQLAPTINPESIVAIIDHHALGGSPITASQLISMDIRAWGSASTILVDRILSSGRTLTPEMACVALGAILSDTVVLTSATTTDYDRDYAQKLLDISGVLDINDFGEEILNAKSDLSQMSEEQILVLDYKNFEYAGQKVGIGVAETLAPDALLARKAGFIKAMESYKQSNNLDYLFFSVMDIKQQRSIFLVLGDDEEKILEDAFDSNVVEEIMVAQDVVSRKKQIGPAIQQVLEAKHK